MKISIIYHSYSGNTRGVAERVHAACGGRLIEVKSNLYSSRPAAYTIGCCRAIRGMRDPIEPETIDISQDDLIIIGTPVWAGRATPAINGAVAALAGCKGKKAVIFATCGGKARETLPILKKALQARGIIVAGEFVFNRTEMKDPERIDTMIEAIRTAGSAP
jgi:flavodoxin